MYEKHYGDKALRLTVTAEVTTNTPLGERTDIAEGIWDTGATNTVIHKRLADRMGIVPMPPLDEDGEPMTTVQTNFLGTAAVRLRIGDVSVPYGLVKVSDLDPGGKYSARGFYIPDLLLGMDLINLGRFCVDSTSGETVLTFEI